MLSYLWVVVYVAAAVFAETQMSAIGPDQEEFIFERAPFPSCHASTLVQLADGSLRAAWFGGKDEGDPSVEIWFSRRPPNGSWTVPERLTDYPQAPCWNPVLFETPDGRLWLFYKVGPSPQTWVGAYKISSDGGATWGKSHYLPAGMLGPIRCKPILLPDGRILAGSSVEAGRGPGIPADAPYPTWASYVELFSPDGKSWERFGPITVPGQNFGVIQPTVWRTSGGHLKMLMRSTERIGAVCESSSQDGGRTWSAARPTSLPNPNAGIDAVKMKDGRVALIYNHTKRGRTPLSLAFSENDGDTWGQPYVLENEPGEYSYPAIIQGVDGKLHMTYTWQRKRIKYVAVDPARLKP